MTILMSKESFHEISTANRSSNERSSTEKILHWKILHWINPPLNKSSAEKILHWKIPPLKSSSTEKIFRIRISSTENSIEGFKYFGMVVQNICICSLKITIELLQSFDNKIEIFCFQPLIFTIKAQILATAYQLFAFWCPIIKCNIFIQKYQYLQFCY